MAELLFPDWDCVAEIHGSAAFADVVPVPGRYLHFHVALHDTLAAQARTQRQARGHVQPVGLVVIQLGKIFHALRHDDVTCRTGAVASAGVFEMDAVVQADIEDRFRLAVLLIRKLSLLELYSLSVDGDFGQPSLYRATLRCLLHTGKTCFISSKSKLPDVWPAM